MTWALVNMYQEEAATMASMHTTMQPTYAAFDTNRGLPGLTQLQVQNSAATCAAGYQPVSVLNWGGNDAGYTTTGGVYAAGAAPSTVIGSTAINAHQGPVPQYVFGGVRFCAKSMTQTQFALRATSATACAAN